MSSRLNPPDLGQIKNGDCNDAKVQESHIVAMLALAKWADAATERINATPEWQQNLCRKMDELTGMLREQVVVRESQKEDILTIKLQLANLIEWQRAHDTRQVRAEDTHRNMLWDVVRPWVQVAVPLAIALYGAHLLGWARP